MRTSVLVAALALAPCAAFADTDPRWLPWIGCWQSASERAVAPDARVCFVPTSDGHVQRIVVTPGDAAATSPAGQPLIADGLEHPLVVPECTGLIRIDWSADGHRYFTSSDRSCIDEVATRTSGLALLRPGPALIEVEAVESSGRETVEVHRYRRVGVPSSLSASLPPDLVAKADAASEQLSTIRLTVAHIIDASSRVHPHALEATVLESNTPFLLNVSGLKALSKARVDESVIDLMIAVSYPEHFAVDQPSTASGGSESYGTMAGSMWDQLPAACYYPFFDPAFCYGSSTFLYSAYRYYETPYYAPPSVIVTPRPPIAPGVPALPSGQARAINGQGYTRVRESEPASSSPSNDSRATSNSSSRALSRSSPPASGARNGSSSSSSSSDSSSSGSSSSGSSSSASSGGGYSSGGGGGDTGRTAVPR
jgi:hypothetical protein